MHVSMELAQEQQQFYILPVRILCLSELDCWSDGEFIFEATNPAICANERDFFFCLRRG